MSITSLRVSNFKSFRDLQIELKDFNVVVGANASGKSNFVQIFRFLRDIQKDGLDNAISVQGGMEYTINQNLGIEKPLIISTSIKTEKSDNYDYQDQGNYELLINLKSNYEIKEKLEDKDLRIYAPTLTIESLSQNEDYSNARTLLLAANNKTRHTVTDFVSSNLFSGSPLDKYPKMINQLKTILISDIERRLIKKSVLNEQQSQTNNPLIILKKRLQNSEDKRMFFNLIRYVFPFVSDVEIIEIEESEQQYLSLKIKEDYNKNYLPAWLVSDGIISIINLIVDLYFENSSIMIIEEPERNIYPHIMPRIVEMMKEVSQYKQIIVITDHPEIVKYTELEDILFIYRDKEGFSCISRLAEKEAVRSFLSDIVRIHDLYIDNFLGLGA